jgi:hypothetical protein
MDTTKIDIRNKREGVYRIVSLYSRDSIAITSQGLLELATWTEENKATLEKEAAKEKGMDHSFRSQDTAEHIHIKSERQSYRTNGERPDKDTA